MPSSLARPRPGEPLNLPSRCPRAAGRRRRTSLAACAGSLGQVDRALRIQYLEDNMTVEVVFYDGKAISVELPTTVVREIETEPAVKGETSGKVMKPAKLVGTGFEIAVPLFVENGDKVEIDTRTHEYKKRV
jgi:Elongation factor P, C-terminal